MRSIRITTLLGWTVTPMVIIGYCYFILYGSAVITVIREDFLGLAMQLGLYCGPYVIMYLAIGRSLWIWATQTILTAAVWAWFVSEVRGPQHPGDVSIGAGIIMLAAPFVSAAITSTIYKALSNHGIR
jgi:hypothetical protein